MADENARALRYRRPVTIVRIELDGFDRLVEIRGDEAGDRLLRATADTLRRLARDTDHVAYLEGGRFGILMPETSDEAAATYVDRVARASELWLESGAVAVRLAIGWAATSGQTDLAVVEQLASGRVRPAPWPVTRPEDSPPGRARAGVATDSPPAMDLSWVAVQARSWETCNDPHCNHKEDHRRDRAAR